MIPARGPPDSIRCSAPHHSDNVRGPSSQDLVKADNRRARQSFRHTDEHRTVQPGVCALEGNLEIGDCPEVVPGRIDRFTARKLLDYFRRPVAHSAVSHQDERAIARLQRVLRLDRQYAIGTDNLPVGTPRNDTATDTWSVERYSRDWHHTSQASRTLSDDLRRRDRDARLKRKARVSGGFGTLSRACLDGCGRRQG